MPLNNHRVEGIYNMMESLVWADLERIAQTERNVCFCSLCKSDMTAFALNRLPAMYVSTQEGEISFKSLEMDEKVHDIIIQAIKHVSIYPHRAKRTMTEHTVNELFDYMDKLREHE